jgi:tol-pal system protein YbgF
VLKTALVKKLCCLGIGLGLASGCCSTKMMEFTYQQLDTVKTTQAELLRRVDELARLYEADRDERVRIQAETAFNLQELRDALETLGYRVDDSAQLIMQRAAPVTPPPRAPIDTTVAGPQGGGAAGPPIGGGADSTSGPAVSDDEAGKLFQASYMDLTLGNYELAVQGFKNYLVRFPGASNAPDARYYLGESYYSLSRYLEAVAEYQTVVKDYPRSRLVPACYLKSGYCYQKLEERDLAEKAFRELISRYPRSEEAERARVELQGQGG